MSRSDTLKSLEALLESFLDRAVRMKENRLKVLEGIDCLDDIARQSSEGADIADQVGDWFAAHNEWLTDGDLRPADVSRISSILGQFKNQLRQGPESSPAEDKIRAEIDRWEETRHKPAQRLVLRRGPEVPAVRPEMGGDTIALFDNKLARLTAVFKDYCQGKKHLLSVADDLLSAAILQSNKDALILSAFIIYYLKQSGYKVEPYVRKLKEAETKIAKEALDA